MEPLIRYFFLLPTLASLLTGPVERDGARTSPAPLAEGEEGVYLLPLFRSSDFLLFPSTGGGGGRTGRDRPHLPISLPGVREAVV